ncbi:protein CIST1-like [Cololabis saira]|uniref:protein CIST1-like n=1 Tax=Cololabis saira TaxID=129043 RepID=UPI002AD32F77|nr:protein CIST1-like [Cololabis saira]
MSAAMHLSVLVCLLAVCSATSAAQLTSSAPSTTPQSQTGTHQFTTDGSTVSPLTPRTEETSLSSSQPTTPTPQASTTTVSQQPTVSSAPGSPNGTEITTVHKTSPVLSPDRGKDDLATNPGLVAVICIFCIILVLVLVVLTVKCIRLPRSNFERLDDVPMGKVNEESPFAHYSK